MTAQDKKKLYYELRSFAMTFLATFVVDASSQINAILSGDYSRAAFLALVTAVLRVLLKVASTFITPSVPTSLNSNLVPTDLKDN